MAIYTIQEDNQQKRLMNPRLQGRKLGSSDSPSLFRPSIHRIDANKKFRSLQVGRRRVRPTDTLTGSIRPNSTYHHKRRRLTPRPLHIDIEPVSPIRLVSPPEGASFSNSQIDESLRLAQSVLSHNKIVDISSPIKQLHRKPVYEPESPSFQDGPIPINLPDAEDREKSIENVEEMQITKQKMQSEEDVTEMKVLRLFLKDGSNACRTSKPLTMFCSSKGIIIRNELDTSFINIQPSQVEIVYISEHRADFRICVILKLKEIMKGKLRTSEVTFKTVRIHLDPCNRNKYDVLVHHLKEYGAEVKVSSFSDNAGLSPTSTKTFYGSERKTRLKVKDPNFVGILGSDSYMQLRSRSHRNIDYHKAHKMEIRLDLDDDQHPEDLNGKRTNVLSPDVAEIVTEAIPYRDQIVFRPPLHYKIAPKKTMIVTNNDFTCLYNSNWINDSIVDFFLNFNYRKAKEAGHLGDNQVEIFNSFFFSQLANPSSAVENCYNNVKSWFKTTDDLFDHEYVIIPIMSELHWYSVIIYNLPGVKKQSMAKRRDYAIVEKKMSRLKKDDASDDSESSVKNESPVKKDDLLGSTSQQKEPESSPSKRKELNIPKEKGLLRKRKKYFESGHIYILDSLRKMHVSVAPLLKNFLIGYAKDKYDLNLDTSDFVRHNAPIPRQKNFNDCGLHVIYNLNVFFQDPKSFQEKVLSKTARVSNDIFRPEERKRMRPTLRKVLIKLLKKQVETSGGNSSKIGTETNDTVAKEKIINGQKANADGDKASSGNDVKSDDEDDDLIIIEPKPIKDAEEEPAGKLSFPVTLKYHSVEPSSDESKKLENTSLNNFSITASKVGSLNTKDADAEISHRMNLEKTQNEDKDSEIQKNDHITDISTEDKLVESGIRKTENSEKTTLGTELARNNEDNKMLLENKVGNIDSTIEHHTFKDGDISGGKSSMKSKRDKKELEMVPDELIKEENLLEIGKEKKAIVHSRNMMIHKISHQREERNRIKYESEEKSMIKHNSDDLIKKESAPVLINLEQEHENVMNNVYGVKIQKEKDLDEKLLRKRRPRRLGNGGKNGQLMAVDKSKRASNGTSTVDTTKAMATTGKADRKEMHKNMDTELEDDLKSAKDNISMRVGGRQEVQIWKEVNIISDKSVKDSETENQESEQSASQFEPSREASSSSGLEHDLDVSRPTEVKLQVEDRTAKKDDKKDEEVHDRSGTSTGNIGNSTRINTGTNTINTGINIGTDTGANTVINISTNAGTKAGTSGTNTSTTSDIDIDTGTDNTASDSEYDDGDGDQEWTETSYSRSKAGKRGRKRSRKRKDYSLPNGIESISARLGRRRKNMEKLNLSEQPDKREESVFSVTPVKLVETKPHVVPSSPLKGRQRKRWVKRKTKEKRQEKEKEKAQKKEQNYTEGSIAIDGNDSMISFKNPLQRPTSISFLGASKRGSRIRLRKKPGKKKRGRRGKRN